LACLSERGEFRRYTVTIRVSRVSTVSRVSKVRRLRIGFRVADFRWFSFSDRVVIGLPMCNEWNYMPGFRRVDTTIN